MVLENSRETFAFILDRTHNRSRSPRIITSSFWYNVSKGSRQIRSVTLGKGLALKAAYGDSCIPCVELDGVLKILYGKHWVIKNSLYM